MTYPTCNTSVLHARKRRRRSNGPTVGFCLLTLLCLPLAAASPANWTTPSFVHPMKRWSGWLTSTTTLLTTVTLESQQLPPATVVSQRTTTVIVTYSQGNGIATETSTFYPSGQAPPTPTVVTKTSTVYPAGVTPPASTTIIAGSSKHSERPAPQNRICLPGDSSYQVPGRGSLTPTPTAKTTLYVIAIFFVTDIVFWNLVLLRAVIYPVKMCVVAWHELGHVVGCVMSGHHILSVSIDPNEGGLVVTRDGLITYPVGALPLGYIMSIMIGGALTFCGFNTLASKVASFFVAITLIIVLWFGSGLLSKMLVLVSIGLLVGFWFIDHASVLRYFVLYFGVMSSFYVIFDTFDDLAFDKPNPCCSVLHSQRLLARKPAFFAWIYFVLSAVLFVLWIFAAIACFRQSGHAMYCQSQSFLPT